MFQVKFIKQVHSCFAAVSSGDIFLEKSFTLPFVPSPCLCINFGGLYIQVPEDPEIVYRVEERIFNVYVDPDRTIYEARLNKIEHPTFASIVQGYIDKGWEISEKDKQRMETVLSEK